MCVGWGLGGMVCIGMGWGGCVCGCVMILSKNSEIKVITRVYSPGRVCAWLKVYQNVILALRVTNKIKH